MKFQMKFQFTTKNAPSKNLKRGEPLSRSQAPLPLARTPNAVISLQFYSTILSYCHNNLAFALTTTFASARRKLLLLVRIVERKVAENSPTYYVYNTYVYVNIYKAQSRLPLCVTLTERVCGALNFWRRHFYCSEFCWCGDNFYICMCCGCC